MIVSETDFRAFSRSPTKFSSFVTISSSSLISTYCWCNRTSSALISSVWSVGEWSDTFTGSDNGSTCGTTGWTKNKWKLFNQWWRRMAKNNLGASSVYWSSSFAYWTSLESSSLSLLCSNTNLVYSLLVLLTVVFSGLYWRELAQQLKKGWCRSLGRCVASIYWPTCCARLILVPVPVYDSSATVKHTSNCLQWGGPVCLIKSYFAVTWKDARGTSACLVSPEQTLFAFANSFINWRAFFSFTEKANAVLAKLEERFTVFSVIDAVWLASVGFGVEPFISFYRNHRIDQQVFILILG